ncbi:hypothetical protein BKA70DRAFT_1103558 [Coprinopsis sp. MPI-PUGE-AT-0042]|nr:hypothetical protein BKA70DRAFT_1103558 [Coprinopsis sp. MPI-PUGE-AT-0042]
MQKRVQFAPSNRAYSPHPPTPSPSISASSLPSTPEIPTPPSEFGALDDEYEDAYTATPYPHGYDLGLPEVDLKEGLVIHCCLAFSHNGEPEISHDLSLPPSTFTSYNPHLPLHEPATYPPQRALTIICPDYFQWKFQIVSKGPYVTVGDVLNELYLQLRVPVTREEYETLGQLKRGVDAAYFCRFNKVADPQLRDLEAGKGVKRIDWLMTRNRFCGLSLSLDHNGPDIWELNVDV